MTHQPHDVFGCTYNDNVIDTLHAKISLYSDVQADNGVPDVPFYNHLPSPSTESLALNNPNDFTNENFDSTETSSLDYSFESNEQLFPGAQLEESSPMDPVEDLDDEDRINLKSVDSSIQQQLISVCVQPSDDRRSRYKSEGKRRIKKIRTDPTTLDLSKLKKYQLDPGELLWLRLNLITVSDEPSDVVYIHPDKLKYYSDQVRVLTDGSVCIPVTQSDINGKLKLTDLSIIKTKHNTYDFKLIPYSLSTIDNKSETYITDEEKTIMVNVRVFRKKFNLKASRIACQLLIEENQSWHFTKIACETDVMIEQEYESTTTKPVKRLKKNNKKSGKKRCSTKRSKLTRRKKSAKY